MDSIGGFLDAFGGELNELVVVFDEVLDCLNGPVFEHAGGSFLVSAKTEVVGVDAAGVAGRVGDAESGLAVAAIDGALEVVRMFSLFFALTASVEDVLDFLPGVFVDDGLVFAFVLDAVEGHNSLVVRAAQDSLELVG